jgi:hypothetical protein
MSIASVLKTDYVLATTKVREKIITDFEST